jgi:predicted DNA-binding transcriptional regulator AlpA
MEQLNTGIDPLLTDYQVSKFTNIAVKTLRGYRLKKTGPPYIKLEGCVRYPQSGLRQWIERAQQKAGYCHLPHG